MGFRFTNWQTSLWHSFGVFAEKKKTSTHKPKMLVNVK